MKVGFKYFEFRLSLVHLLHLMRRIMVYTFIRYITFIRLIKNEMELFLNK